MCPKCGVNNKYRDGMVCASCRYHFTLDPKSDGMADARFLAILDGATGNDTYYITENQLYTAYCRKNYAGPFIPGVLACGFFGVAIGLYFFGGRQIGGWVWIPVVIGAICGLVSLSNFFSSPPDRERGWHRRPKG